MNKIKIGTLLQYFGEHDTDKNIVVRGNGINGEIRGTIPYIKTNTNIIKRMN